MKPEYAFHKIDNKDFDALIERYPDALPAKLNSLDDQRYRLIPAKVKERREKGDAFLTKQEVATLVEWKVSHGRFRPTLKALFQQNDEETVIDTTRQGCSAYASPTADSAKSSLQILTKLRGIGPATASLLLSVYAPETAPFFSVGLFGWSMQKPGHGREWEQGIKYNLKEYLDLFAHVQQFRQRLGVSALDAEKAGYVVGKTDAAVASAEGSGGGGTEVPGGKKRTARSANLQGEKNKEVASETKNSASSRTKRSRKT